MDVRISVWPVAAAVLLFALGSPGHAAQRGHGGGGHGGGHGGFFGGGGAFGPSVGGAGLGGVASGPPQGTRTIINPVTGGFRWAGPGGYYGGFRNGGFHGGSFVGGGFGGWNGGFSNWNCWPWFGGGYPFYGGFGGFPLYAGLGLGAYPFYGGYPLYGGYPYSYAAGYSVPTPIVRNEVFYLTPPSRSLEMPATPPPAKADEPPPKPLTPVPNEHADHDRAALSPLELVRRQLRVEDAESGVYLVRWSAPAGKAATVELRALDADRKPLDTRTFKEAPYRGLLKVPASTKRIEVTVESPDGASVSIQLPVEGFRALADE